MDSQLIFAHVLGYGAVAFLFFAAGARVSFLRWRRRFDDLEHPRVCQMKTLVASEERKIAGLVAERDEALQSLAEIHELTGKYAKADETFCSPC